MRLGLSNLLFKKPSKEQMDICAEEGFRSGPNHLVPGASLEFALEDSSVTRLTRVSDGWIEDYDAVKVGEGEKAYSSACKAIASWQHMSLGWVETNKPTVAIGSKLCIAAQMLCFWQLNPLQIVYVSEGRNREDGLLQSSSRGSIKSSQRGRYFKFGQTTLEGHALAGEERFSIQWRPDNSVWYEIYAFSKAQTALAFAAYPFRRHYQHKFRRDSARHVKDAVKRDLERQ